MYTQKKYPIQLQARNGTYMLCVASTTAFIPCGLAARKQFCKLLSLNSKQQAESTSSQKQLLEYIKCKE